MNHCQQESDDRKGSLSPAKRETRRIANFPVLRGWIIIFVLWGFAFALACRLLSMPEQQQTIARSLAAKLSGGARCEVSGNFYEQADSVFHKGIGHFHPNTGPDWFAKMRREIAPMGHAHLHEEGVLEIMPWLYFAVRADPGNITAYAVAAYWLAGDGRRPDLAEQVLNEALRSNLSDYRVYMEKGNLALKEGRYEKAARWLDAALPLWPGEANQDKDQARVDLAEILTYRGLLHEISGSPENALRCYREVVHIFPGRTQLKERMMELEKNGRSPTPPENLARILLFQRRYVCAEDEGG